MRKLAVSRVLLILLVATLLPMSIVKAGTWSSPSMITDPTFCGSGISSCPSISGDGNKIAFVTGIDMETSEIFVINSDGTGLTQLTNNTENIDNPSISGDGSKIAFTDSVYGDKTSSEIFVINSDGTGLTQLTDYPDDDYYVPSSSPSIVVMAAKSRSNV